MLFSASCYYLPILYSEIKDPIAVDSIQTVKKKTMGCHQKFMMQVTGGNWWMTQTSEETWG